MERKKNQFVGVALTACHPALHQYKSTTPHHLPFAVVIDDILEREEPTRALDPLVPMGGVVEPPLII